MAMKERTPKIVAVAVCLAFAAASTAAECPNHCTEDRIAAYAAMTDAQAAAQVAKERAQDAQAYAQHASEQVTNESCAMPEGHDSLDLCALEMKIALTAVFQRGIACQHPVLWTDNQSSLWRVTCINDAPGKPLGLTSTSYGLGLQSLPSLGEIRVVTFEKITSDAMWAQWVNNARESTCSSRGGYFFGGPFEGSCRLN
jgi:hypothetical protein